MIPAFHVPVVIVPIDTRLDKVVTAEFTKVPDVGNVTDVGPVNVRPKEYAPVVVNEPAVEMLPPRVMVFEPLLTPVPP
jgi:hypothetical protein